MLRAVALTEERDGRSEWLKLPATRCRRGVGGDPMLDAAGDQVLGTLDGFDDVRPLGQLGGQRGGDGATGAGDPLLPDLRGAEAGDLLAVPQHVHGVVAGKLDSTLGQDIGDVLTDAFRGLLKILDGLDALHAGQGLGLEDIRRHYRGQRKDLLPQCVVGVQRRAGLLPLADQHGVDHEVPPAAIGELLGHGVDGLRVPSMPTLAVSIDSTEWVARAASNCSAMMSGSTGWKR